MSRRRERAWQELLSRHVLGGGEEYYTDWEGVAREVGLSADDFRHPDYDAGGWEVDIDELSAALRDAFFDRREGEPPPLAMITLKCQRCDRRLDTWRMRATRWTAPAPGSEGWKLENPRITSEAWARDVGDSMSELFRKFEGRSINMSCVCGVQNIQFSVRRLGDTLIALTPDNPRWSPGGDDANIVWPTTRHATIRG